MEKNRRRTDREGKDPNEITMEEISSSLEGLPNSLENLFKDYYRLDQDLFYDELFALVYINRLPEEQKTQAYELLEKTEEDSLDPLHKPTNVLEQFQKEKV